jgi:hypothetical protein
MEQRLVVFSLSLAVSFATLILFVGYAEGIIVSVLFLTVAVVAASTTDLKQLASGKWTFAGLIAVVTALIVGICVSLPQLNSILFMLLVLLNAAALASYFVMRKNMKTPTGSERLR